MFLAGSGKFTLRRDGEVRTDWPCGARDARPPVRRIVASTRSRGTSVGAANRRLVDVRWMRIPRSVANAGRASHGARRAAGRRRPGPKGRFYLGQLPACAFLSLPRWVDRRGASPCRSQQAPWLYGGSVTFWIRPPASVPGKGSLAGGALSCALLDHERAHILREEDPSSWGSWLSTCSTLGEVPASCAAEAGDCRCIAGLAPSTVCRLRAPSERP
jgi:hypothetical protein